MRWSSKKIFFESKAALVESSDIFLYQFQINHDKHKKFSFGVEQVLDQKGKGDGFSQ